MASGFVADLVARGHEDPVAEDDVLRRDAALIAIDHAVLELLVKQLDPDPRRRLAILYANDHVLSHVHEPARQVPRVGCAQGGVRQPLACAVG